MFDSGLHVVGSLAVGLRFSSLGGFWLLDLVGCGCFAADVVGFDLLCLLVLF